MQIESFFSSAKISRSWNGSKHSTDEIRLVVPMTAQSFYFTTTTFQLPGPWTTTTLSFTPNINNTNHN